MIAESLGLTQCPETEVRTILLRSRLRLRIRRTLVGRVLMNDLRLLSALRHKPEIT
jgi:hypothetical protein